MRRRVELSKDAAATKVVFGDISMEGRAKEGMNSQGNDVFEVFLVREVSTLVVALM